MTNLNPVGSANPLVDGTACLLVHFKRPGIKRKLRKDQFEAGNAEKDLLGASKQIIDAPEYRQIAAFECHVKFYLASKALPSKLYRWSTYLIPLAVMKDVDAFLETARAEWAEKVEAFVAVYPERKKETMERLGTVGNPDDYKTEGEIRQDFGFDHEYVTMSTPSTLKQISAAMFEREEQRLRERLKTAEGEIVAAFRSEFATLVEGMKSMLDGEEKGGKTQRFHGWKIAKLQKYVDEFKSQSNVCDDNALTKLMDEASKLLAGVDPKELKDDTKWRASLSTSFGDIASKLTEMTKVRGIRQIDVDGDDEAA
jgi:hypothetical protein